jgi:hypothetical protein
MDAVQNAIKVDRNQKGPIDHTIALEKSKAATCCIHLRVFRSKTCRFTPNSRVNAPKIMKIVQKKGKTHDFHEKKRKNRLFSGGGQKSLTRHPE